MLEPIYDNLPELIKVSGEEFLNQFNYCIDGYYSWSKDEYNLYKPVGILKDEYTSKHYVCLEKEQKK